MPASMARRPGEEQSAEEADAGGERKAQQCQSQAILPAAARDKEGADRDPVKGQDAQEE